MDKLYGLIQDINPEEICNHIENGNLVEWCNAWRIAAKEALQQKSNADRIRAMSDEELEDLFREVYNDGYDDATAWEWGIRQNTFIWDEEWLKKPAEGE